MVAKLKWLNLISALSIIIFLATWYFEAEGFIERSIFKNIAYVCVLIVSIRAFFNWLQYFKK